MDRVSEAAAAVESTVDSLVSVLEAASLAQTPNVPPAQLRVLSIIALNQHTNMNRLAEALEVVPSSASRLCDRLEATGLLRRVPDPRDRREVRLMITPAARRLLDQLHERRRQALAQVIDRMTPGDQKDLVRVLQAFADATAHENEDDGQNDALRTA